MSRRHVLFSLVLVLSVSTLASADSVPVSAMRLHSSAAVSVKVEKATPAMLIAFQQPSHEAWNRPLKSDDSTSHLLDRSHGTIARRNSDWFIRHNTYPVSPMTTPEPGTLMLLSTGLSGIAALVRRKMRRA